MKKFGASLLYIAIIAVVIYSVFLFRVPAVPHHDDQSHESFSATRALAHVKKISFAPHGIGTAAHDSVRNIILNECRKLALQPRVQRTQGMCVGDSYIKAGNIENIVAVLKGDGTGHAIVLMAHYDSQPNTYGAADNGAGVATLLEIAGLLKRAGKVYKNDVVFLFTDGEEEGLLGSCAFTEQELPKLKMGLVINMDARGNSGSSIMFEANQNNGWMIKQLSDYVEKPIASSVYSEMYRLVANETDYTPFKERGVTGVNFAFIEGFAHYHSFTDTPGNLNLASVQDQGEDSFSLIKHLVNEDLSVTIGENVTFFNVPLVGLVHYPASWNHGLLGLTAMTLLALVALNIKKRILPRKAVLAGFLGVPAILAMNLLLVAGFRWCINSIYPHYDNFYASNSYNAYYYYIAATALSVSVTTYCLLLLARMIGKHSVILAVYLVTLILGIMLHAYSDAAYLLLIPLLTLLVANCFLNKDAVDSGTTRKLGLLFLGSLPALILIPTVIYDLLITFGLSNLIVAPTLLTGVLVSLILTASLQLDIVDTSGVPLVGIAVFCLFIVVAHLNSNYTAQRPLQTNMYYQVDVDENNAKWVSDDNEPDIGNSIYFPNPKINQNGQLENDAPIVSVARPVMEVMKDSVAAKQRFLRLKYTHPKKPYSVFFNFTTNAPINSLRINGVPVNDKIFTQPFFGVEYYNISASGIVFDISMRVGQIDCWSENTSIGFTPQLALRPTGDNVIPAHGNRANTTKVIKRFKF